MISRIARGLAITLVIALVGGAFLIIRTTTQAISGLPVLAILVAIAIVAPAFVPLQEVFERLANQFVRASQPTTAYHVLADLTTLSRATSADASNLTGVAEAIATRLGARSCQLTVVNPGLRDRSYTWSAGHSPGAADADDDIVLPIRQGSEQIGRIAVNRAAGVGTQRRQLLEDIANSLGAIVAVSRLGIELERKHRAAVAHAEEIALARRQAVAEMDNERRRMERNLHDGAQHHLVSLRMTLGLVEHGITSGQLTTATEGLGRLATQISNAEAVLAETATGVSSVLLTKHGLIAALNADLSGMHPPIVVTSPEALSSRRFPPEVETAVYFCCLEAVNNARKHAPGAAVSVRLAELDAALRFAVRDDGPGFVLGPANGDSETKPGPPRGRGMRNVRARITAVGGTISIRSAPGAGTTVEGAVPLPRQQNLLKQARELVREARQVYDGSAQSEQLRELQIQLDRPLPAQADGRAGAIRASSVLRALDAILRSSPRGGDRALTLRYQLEQVRSGTHELTEIELLEELRSGSLPLSADERRMAEQLLGASGAEPRVRLGLGPAAGSAEVRQIAGQQRERWQRRASHPASPRAVRHAAEVLTLTCEQLLAQISTE